MTSTTLHSRIVSLTDARKTTHGLIHRLSRLPAQPGIDNSEVRAELSGEIHQLLKEQEEELELLRQEVEDFTVGRDPEREAEKARLEIGVQRLGEDLRLARTQFRKAQLQAKRHAEAARHQERELLLAGANEDGESQRPKDQDAKNGGAGREISREELVVNASSDVTAALRRTHQLMQSELSRSRFAQETLEQSTEALQTLTENYSNISSLLTNSRSLLSTLVRSQKSDTWYLETAFYILVATIIWLIFRRFFYGPLWWFVWFPLKLLFRTSAAALGAIGLGRAKSASSISTARTSLITKPSATGAFPTWGTNDQAPRIVVGGGHKDPSDLIDSHTRAPTFQATIMEDIAKTVEQAAKEQASRPPQSAEASEKTKPEEGHNDAEVGDSEAPRNAKKRMWEEDKEAQKLAEGSKDEL